MPLSPLNNEAELLSVEGSGYC